MTDDLVNGAFRFLGAEADPPRRKLGKYDIIREIARGGMGIVYEAQDPDLRRRVALKVLKDADVDENLVRRLHREAAVAARLTHPNIVGVHEVSTVREGDVLVHFIAMDYVEGGTFADVLRSDRPLPALVRMLEDIALAVGFAHSKGVVHRDLKPGNVLVDESGRVILTDFGLARAQSFATRLTASQAAIGTPQYMAPEQVVGHQADIDARTDVYALGVMLYEILCGRLPFDADTPAQLFYRILNAEPDPPSRSRSVARDLELICLKAMDKQRTRRYRDAAGFAEDLRRWREHEPILARPPSVWHRCWKLLRKRSSFVAAGGLVLLASAAAAFAVLQAKRVRASAAELQRRKDEEEVVAALLERLAPMPENAERAIELLDEALAKYPSASRLWMERGRRNMKRGRNGEACEDFRRAYRANPRLAEAHHLRGRLLAGADDRAGAAAEFRRALEIEPEHEHARVGAAWIAELDGRYREAIDACDRAEAAGRHLDDLYFVRGKARAGLGHYLRSVEDFGLALARRATPWAYCARGASLGRLGRHEEGMADFEQALALDRAFAEAWSNRGYAKWRLNRLLDALSDLNEAIRLRPGHASTHQSRGRVRFALGDVRGAEADFTECIRLAPGVGFPFHARGLAREKLGDESGALEDYERQLAETPGHAETLVRRGMIRSRRGDVRGAAADYDLAAGRDPANKDAWTRRGVLRQLRGDLAGALTDYDRALQLDDTCPEARMNRATVLRAAGRHRESLEEYGAAIQLMPTTGLAYFNRAVARAAADDLWGVIWDLSRVLEFSLPTTETFRLAWRQLEALRR